MPELWETVKVFCYNAFLAQVLGCRCIYPPNGACTITLLFSMFSPMYSTTSLLFTQVGVSFRPLSTGEGIKVRGGVGVRLEVNFFATFWRGSADPVLLMH